MLVKTVMVWDVSKQEYQRLHFNDVLLLFISIVYVPHGKNKESAYTLVTCLRTYATFSECTSLSNMMIIWVTTITFQTLSAVASLHLSLEAIVQSTSIKGFTLMMYYFYLYLLYMYHMVRIKKVHYFSNTLCSSITAFKLRGHCYEQNNIVLHKKVEDLLWGWVGGVDTL
jgi:hypothetical protein